MKIRVLIVMIAVFLAGANGAAGEQSKTVTVSGAWALYPMAVKWAEEYKKINPDTKIDIAAGGAGKGMADTLAGIVDIGMVSREIAKEEAQKGAFGIAVTRDAVVPTINVSNPNIKLIMEKGIKRSQLADVWLTEKVKSWPDILGQDAKGELHSFTRSDSCGAAETWAKYLGAKQEDFRGIGVYGDPGVAEAVRKDVLGIGYNNVGYAYDAKTGKNLDGLAVIPIDTNDDGKIGQSERFYDNSKDLIKAIVDGRYPSPPARELFFVTKGAPASKDAKLFIEWVLKDGQRFVPEAGYIKLPEKKLATELARVGEK